MQGSFFSLAALLLLPIYSASQNLTSSFDEKKERLDSVIVTASRAGENTPMTYTMIGKDEVKRFDQINSLPMNLKLQPSVVTYNEGGNGLGNSYITVRGSSGSQINVTLNGITLNDAESQQVFWVNIPSLSGITTSVQLQRGLGTSANGAGAFGASVNMSTASVGEQPFGEANVSAGSFGTILTSVSAGTGLTKSGLYFNGTYSKGYTDGYIRNGKVNSQSLFAVLGWMKGDNSLRLTYLSGMQKSGITWDGIDLEQYKKDRRYNGSGKYKDEFGNTHYYDNSTDNYAQHHLQLNYTHRFNSKFTWTSTFNYTRGDGYDEYYKAKKAFKKYGLPEKTEVNGKEYTSGDIIYRKMMGNNYFVLNSDLKFMSAKAKAVGGVNISKYTGRYFGKVLWSNVFGDKYDYSTVKWYENNSVKYDLSAFIRAEYMPFDLLSLYCDLQYRHINLGMQGKDDDKAGINYKNNWNFFNPRAGLLFNISDRQQVYMSAALGHREPGRKDIKENIKGAISPIRPEKMLDMEFGYKYASERFAFTGNVYFMEYWDMLLETGKLSSSGYKIKENVARGYRRGVELAASYIPFKWLKIEGNTAFSMNRLNNYNSYVDVKGGVPYETKVFNYKNTNMLMSPSFVGMAQLSFYPVKRMSLSVNGKYVGKQYIDNTSRDEMAIPGYFVSDLALSQTFNLKTGKLGITAYINNVFNNMYYASGWRWESYDKNTQKLSYGIGVYPQAPVNFMLRMTYSF
ncbi:MAG: TonB-dependent receptor [Candidatus Cryptobacteroides sp.]